MHQVSPQEVAEALGLPPPTAEQAAVVAAPAEPALVVAGAGAGKTETMAARVVWLVANGLVTPDRVLGLTFTRKAARQLADRVKSRLRRLAGSPLLDRVDPSGDRRAVVLSTEPTVLTYHAYAGRLVGEHGLRLPVEPGARLLTETAAWQLAHRVVSTWTEDLDTDKVPVTITGYLLRLAGELAEHLVSPEQLTEHAERLRQAIESAPRAPRQRADLPVALREIVEAQRLRVALMPLLAEYGVRKRREAALDFADQMSLAAKLAAEHPEVVEGERARYGAVLLDEYQDTGHAQRVLLRSLFGMGAPIPVTAVGDPAQAIYGWRGASAANLPRFTTDFPRADLRPAAKYGLLTSFRNPPEVLAIANELSGPLRAAGLDVDELRAKPGAGEGDVRCALLPDVRSEVAWLADELAARWEAQLDAEGKPPTSAVLVRRRADMAAIATALRERGLPVEVVGLGGLLDEPEVRDLYSALRVLVDPLAGTAAARLLTGSRWRLGAADLAALWKRAGEIAGRRTPVPSDDPLSAIAEATPGEHAEQAGLVDALDDPGDPEQYSEQGVRRIRRLRGELMALRRRLDQPLPELVADVERTLLLDIEAVARPGRVGRAHLDAFAGVVADYAAASPSASLASLLDYLRTAENAEDGLEPGEVEVAEDRVQVLTMHAAKGLEWGIVVVPHVVRDVFPGRRKSASWLKSITELPADLRGDAQDLPKLNLAGASNRKEVEEALAIHSEEFEERRLIEERRLCYVALTRSERVLLVSGHWWGETGEKPRGPSEFLDEVRAAVEQGDRPPGVVDEWAPPPAEDEKNPLAAAVRTATWPIDPLGARREPVAAGAAMVLAALNGAAPAPVPVLTAVPVEEEVPLPEPPPEDEEFPPEYEDYYEQDPYAEDPPPPDYPANPADPLASPANPFASPADLHTSPADHPASPVHLLASPADPLASPADPLASPADPFASPAEPLASPVDLHVSPAEHNASGRDSRSPDRDSRVGEEDPEGWAADVEVLLAEREAARSRRELVALPDQLTVSQLVELAADPDELARRLRRPLPFPPNALARRGTAFHAWLERRFGATTLLDLDELPGAADETARPDADLEQLCAAFLASQWADRVPHEVEVPFETEVDGVSVRGRMDAVFRDADGGWTVVDWKTGAVPDAARLPALSVQLAAYRLAWAALKDVPLEQVRAAFHYVRHDHTLRPTDLLDGAGLRELLRSVARG
ncbi:DNA helicase-2/ATP-dependent DNA helicase PcrA [Kutzneria viridogrisea]|uniref:DNA 3'-5' helicase n=1 Tax=Kutzneria viridogrisea TaxID=47990 RepID=A0ABR6BT37_9PSEU|nr:DNA helicase-2/ATP-dependent DNA helicase PcrA [Kutzneria viridogrisea]